MLDIFEDIIGAKEGCAQWYKGENVMAAVKEDDGHRFFISALQETHDTVGQGNVEFVAHDGTSEGHDETTIWAGHDSNSTDHLCNIFECLKLEETVDDGSDLASSSTRQCAAQTQGRHL